MTKGMRRFVMAVAVLVAVVIGRAPLVSHLTCDSHGIAAAAERTVYFNTKSRVYHHDGCNAGRSCTVNCIWIPISEARARGGRPCGRCGG
jgi:hypothetical protein